MVLVETNFPRGGTIQKREPTETTQEFGAKQLKKRKKKTNDDKDSEVQHDFKVEAVSAELLTYKTIQEGMILYGIIKRVNSVGLTVSLPGRLVGKISAASISNSYNKVLKEFIQSSEKVENFKTLEELFSVGQSIYAKVAEIKENDSKTRVELVLSSKPSDVHSNLFHEKVKKGMVLIAAIEEIQDRGYVIESGIKNLRCFLPREDADESAEETLGIGQLVFVKIQKLTQFKDASTAICQLKKYENTRKVKDILDPLLEYLMPSSVVNFTITKVLNTGLQGTIMNGNFTAYVNEHQLKEIFALPTDYEVNATISVKILYIMPLSKLVYLSLRNKNQVLGEANILKRGTIAKATVYHYGTGGVIFQIDDEKKAILSFSSLKSSLNQNFDQDNLYSKYGKNSVHKIRILDYDYVDEFYVCTDNPNVLDEKYFVLDDLKAGEYVTAIVTELDKADGKVYLKIGNCNGIMEKIFQASQTSLTVAENSKIKCRVMALDVERNVVYVTNRPEYIKNDSKILSNISQARKDASFLGTIVKCTEKFFIVKFFDGIKGILYKSGIPDFLSNESESFHPGHTTFFRIMKKEGNKLLLTLNNEIFKTGDVCKATVQNYLESGLEISIPRDDGTTIKGLVPARLLTDFQDLNITKLKTYIPEQPIEVACTVQNIFSIRDVDSFKEKPIKKFSQLRAGDILRGSIKNINGDVAEVWIPVLNYNKLIRIHLEMMLIKLTSKPSVIVEPDQVIHVKILGKDARTLSVSAKLTDVWNGDFSVTANIFAKYLDEVKQIKKSFKSQNHPLGNIQVGEVVEATLSFEIKESSMFYIELENGVQGIIKEHLFAPEYKENNEKKKYVQGDKVQVIVLWIDYANEFVYCSNQNSAIKKIVTTSVLPKNFVNTSGAQAKVLLVFDHFVICSLKQNQNPLIFVPREMHYNDFESSVTTKPIEGDFCRLCFVHEKLPIAVFEETMKIWKTYKVKKRKFEEMEEQKKKKLKMDINCLTEPIESRFKEDLDKFSDTENDKLLVSEDVKQPTPKPKSKDSYLPGANNFWAADVEVLNEEKNVESSSEDEDECTDESKSKKKRVTAADRFKAEKIEEARIREIENKYANPNEEPESADQFDRLVLSNPNSSKIWIKYMAFHLQTTEIDKARSVAKRAVKSISFREEEELINVWVALLNLESNYGNKQSFNDSLKEALLCSDPLKIYIRVIEILTSPKKVQELTEVIATVTKKFKDNPEVWKTSASALFQVDLKEKGQQLLHRSLAALPERDHVSTIVAFANINHKHGDKETAHTLMEQVLTSYPKRVDIWSQYVDMLLKDAMINAARRTLEKAVTQKIPLKKMRTMFKKYLEFEEKYGNETNVLKVKELAQNYVKNEG